MGKLPAGLIARDVPMGETIACVTGADHLITAGVSHWGAYGLIAGLAARVPAWRETLLSCLDPEPERDILECLVTKGPAVDGVTLGQTLTIDGFDLAVHRSKCNDIRWLVEDRFSPAADPKRRHLP
jgi:hypothetical protein